MLEAWDEISGIQKTLRNENKILELLSVKKKVGKN